MSSYDFLAGCYDELTTDVGYPAWADYLEATSGGRGCPDGRCWTWPAGRVPSPGSWLPGGTR